MLEDAKAALVVTDRVNAARFAATGATLVELERDAAAIAARSALALESSAGALAAAYVMYTSGSTGRPKGTVVPHRAIARLVRKTDYVEILPSDTLLSYAPLAFDASTFEIWGALLSGARLAVPPPGLQTMEELAATIDRFGVTILWLTAALFARFVDSSQARPRSLRCVLTGGDVISPGHARRFLEAFPGCRLINGYGPTENTTFSTAHAIGPRDLELPSLPIGRPIANSSAYVLDAKLRPLPAGIAGELCVGGDGLALEYLNAPELSAESFVADPFSEEPGARLYRTGDRARLRQNGVIEFLGRSDAQVKIRGYRVELGEIETALATHPGVAQSVATLGEDAAGDKAVWAYVVPHAGGAALASSDLRAWIEGRLPSFMQPARIEVLPALPQTENGKIDRRALPRPQAAPRGAPPAPGYRSPAEAKVGALLCELLGQASIERDADIFALGFHSLLALRFVAHVEQTFGVRLKLRALFERPTVASIAAYLEPEPATPNGAAVAVPIVTLNPEGRRAALTFMHGDIYADGIYCRRLAAAIGSAQPVHAVAPHGTAGLPLFETIEAMATDYVGRVRAVQPNGPYRLGGFCVSGLVAYETARLLRAQGETVERLVLVNASPMPSRSIRLFDVLLRGVATNAGLSPKLRDSLCYNLARFHAALVSGPERSSSSRATRRAGGPSAAMGSRSRRRASRSPSGATSAKPKSRSHTWRPDSPIIPSRTTAR